ncbi:hypothetical protein J1N35_041806 [Gossypium stocksii]|uniref:Uncharacterized protein n=1 Tax=Gossypium stocksii TaxID=47602 RepID=A0A9D3ZJR5_9ROSI|nr:hypothetical protein J1N35_041806 [Gossypium stocksii]
MPTKAGVGKCWEEPDEIAHYYMLASMTNTSYKQLESCKTAKAILDKLEDMFRGQATLARLSSITSLTNAQQMLNTPIKDHMITLMESFAEAIENETNLDQITQIEMMFKSFSKDFFLLFLGRI